MRPVFVYYRDCVWSEFSLQGLYAANNYFYSEHVQSEFLLQVLLGSGQGWGGGRAGRDLGQGETGQGRGGDRAGAEVSQSLRSFSL